ncbi:uncharacterized protein LOC105837383 [Monomorium pharaonis]|uniref:uncharacterized protein LOC105837383 n=1 Tax=Monomorium pharaonis TaxID=307658 RepID=UPI00174676D9|nr:uncharacterized protein LOC105837383 [Monomorium pharaonis]
MQILKENFDLSSWKVLSECTLILIQIFNRKRAGEIERLTLSDYTNQETIDTNENPDIYEKLSKEAQQYAKKFTRIIIRGKKGRIVPVLLSAFIIKCIDTILKYRKNAGAKSNNKYVFCVPSANKLKKKYLRACPLMRKFAKECGAIIPSSLRGTTLRKQVATYTAMSNIEDAKVDNLANFMGHTKEIHKNIYRMPIPVKEMTDVSQLLEAAMGNDENTNEDCNMSDTNSALQLSITSEEIEKNNISDSDNDNFDDITTEQSYNKVMTSDHSLNNDMNNSYSNYSHSQFDTELSNEEKKQPKRRSTPPYGKTKRIRWSEEEKHAISKHFGNVLELPQLPSIQECQHVINKYKILKKRQPQQLKTWIDNQRRAEYRRKIN